MSPVTDSLNSLNLPPDQRYIVAFPEIDEFYDVLMDRCRMVLRQFFLTDPFTIFINALPRDHEVEGIKQIDRFDFKDIQLIYAGVDRQREFLEGKEKDKQIKKLDIYWEELKSTKALSEKETKVSFKLYSEYRKGDYGLEDIKDKGVGTLKDYFYPKDKLTPAQKAEFAILTYHFPIDNYYYFSVPLIQFAEFDGVVHIILSKKDLEENFLSKDGQHIHLKSTGNVIKAFSREYEGIILDWDTTGGAKYQGQSFNEALLDRARALYTYNEKHNPILMELNYREYYEEHKTYFDDRVKYNKKVPLDISPPYRQSAIMHILIDSYAHNISAHSLTALEWWFRMRADAQDQKAIAIEDGNTQPDLSFLDTPVALLKQYEKLVDREIHPLLRFLLDKGAFWTGLTRDRSFGGRIRNLYDVLWEDFVNNPLYLGTIAFTEGIMKINLDITFLDFVRKDQKHHLWVEKKVRLDGNFVKIDLTQFEVEIIKEGDKRISSFIKKGTAFEDIATELKNHEVFFPGGVVGVHAFFTILETELRNVKHYTREELEIIKNDGLTLNISIEGDFYDRKNAINRPPNYYKIGVWLKHRVLINKTLIKKRPDMLKEDIVQDQDADYKPRLGGTYQDKVCAAMLFNNSFISVEVDDDKEKEKPRYQKFYPWIKTGSNVNLLEKNENYKLDEIITDYQISTSRLYLKDQESVKFRNHFDANFKDHTGYLKKFFYLWKGESICDAQTIYNVNNDFENISRFRFVYVSAGEERNKLFQQVREAGIIRIIHEKTDDPIVAYREWLRRWLRFVPGENRYLLDLAGEEGSAAEIELTKDNIIYRNKNLTRKEQLPKTLQKVTILHSPDQNNEVGKAVVRYRRHGIFYQKFLKGKDKFHYINDFEEDLAAELLEILGTRICIFDNRIASRFKGTDMNIFTEQLYCTIHDENEQKWEAEKKAGFFGYHFLVVHLSFIEAFGKSSGTKKYIEEDIQQFVDDEILQGRQAPDNFILVITTGRGRTQWWNKLKEKQQEIKPLEVILPSYTSFVTFRPVESLTAAIESSISIKDDMELKYRLVKVLIGS